MKMRMMILHDAHDLHGTLLYTASIQYVAYTYYVYTKKFVPKNNAGRILVKLVILIRGTHLALLQIEDPTHDVGRMLRHRHTMTQKE